MSTALLPDEHRAALRQRVLIAAKIRYGGGAASVECVVRNLSEEGAKVQLSEAVSLPAHFELVVPQKNVARRCELRWRRGDEAGIAFLDAPGAGEAGPASLDEEALRRRIRTLEAEVARLRARIVELGG